MYLAAKPEARASFFGFACDISASLRAFVRWTPIVAFHKYAGDWLWGIPVALQVFLIQRFGSLRKGDALVSHAEDQSSTRRDFLYYATGGTGAVVAGAAVWPLVNQMNPSADVQAASRLRVDVSGVSEGTQLTVLFLGKPVFIRRRTADEIEAGRSVEVSELVDQIARNPNLGGDVPATDENRTLTTPDGENSGEWLVMQGVCTHLGCVPLGDGAGDFGGWFCPCHGSHYDTAGRIRRGPAPENLHIPAAEFVDDATLVLG